MLNFVWASRRNTIENIKVRNTFITGKVTEDQGNGKYKLSFSGSDKDYPNVFTIQTDPTYAVNDHVGVLLEYGNDQMPVVAGIMRPMQFREVTSGVNSLGT